MTICICLSHSSISFFKEMLIHFLLWHVKFHCIIELDPYSKVGSARWNVTDPNASFESLLNKLLVLMLEHLIMMSCIVLIILKYMLHWIEACDIWVCSAELSSRNLVGYSYSIRYDYECFFLRSTWTHEFL